MTPALPVGAAMVKTTAQVNFLSDDARLKTGVLALSEGRAPPASGCDGLAWVGCRAMG